MRSLRHLLSLALVLIFATATAAEYCTSQGSPALKKSDVPGFDAKVVLTQGEIAASEAKHLPWGRPECPRILFHREYVVCFDEPRKVAGWASYRMEKADVVDATRVNAFRTDPRFPTDRQASCDDYKGSGFDRGHLVPRADMNRTLTALVNTFFLTNMSPQEPNHNQGVWARLEDLGRVWTKGSGPVHIVSGTIFDGEDGQPTPVADRDVITDTDVGVPTKYFKVFIREVDGQMDAIAFIMPNTNNVPGRTATDAKKDAYLKTKIRTVSEIERRKGVDLFPDMDPALKERLRKLRADDLWSSN